MIPDPPIMGNLCGNPKVNSFVFLFFFLIFKNSWNLSRNLLGEIGGIYLRFIWLKKLRWDFFFSCNDIAEPNLEYCLN